VIFYIWNREKASVLLKIHYTYPITFVEVTKFLMSFALSATLTTDKT